MLNSGTGKKRSTKSLKLGFLLPPTLPLKPWLVSLKDTSLSTVIRDRTVHSSIASFRSLGFGNSPFFNMSMFKVRKESTVNCVNRRAAVVVVAHLLFQVQLDISNIGLRATVIAISSQVGA